MKSAKDTLDRLSFYIGFVAGAGVILLLLTLASKGLKHG